MKNKIIIVDDDEGIQDIFKLIFDKAGYKTTIFSNGSTIMTGHYQLPDLYLLDKELAGKSGVDICRFLKSHKETKDIPVLIVSAIEDLPKVARAAGADGYIEKPFKRSELLHKVFDTINNSNANAA